MKKGIAKVNVVEIFKRGVKLPDFINLDLSDTSKKPDSVVKTKRIEYNLNVIKGLRSTNVVSHKCKTCPPN
jgi:hypothetical protein